VSSNEQYEKQIDELSDLIAEFKLSEATIQVGDFRISMKKSAPKVVMTSAVGAVSESDVSAEEDFGFEELTPVVAAPVGTPISSPMTGIYYSASSPSSPPFVKEGDTVNAGQVVGLIEAMKVFNEIQSTVSGVVKKIVAESGQVMNPGEPILFIG
jgi:acetyl-CoA carboxylase biotin carboxyl carrier protein